MSLVNQAISLGTGRANDVAESNVLTGLMNKDPMYTKFWLSHKHPDFRRPYVHKIDSDDLLAGFRHLVERTRQHQIERQIREAADAQIEEELRVAEKEIDEWMRGWESEILLRRDRKYTQEEQEVIRELKELLDENDNKIKDRKERIINFQKKWFPKSK